MGATAEKIQRSGHIDPTCPPSPNMGSPVQPRDYDPQDNEEAVSLNDHEERLLLAHELTEETDQTGKIGSTNPIGQSRRDMELVIRKNVEQFERLYPRIQYIQLNRAKSRPDPLYRERIFKKFNDPILVSAYFQLSPPEKLLRKFGIEVEATAIAVFSNRILNRKRLKVLTGDRVMYLGVTFEVITMKLLDYFLNTQVPINTVAILKQVAKR